MLSPVLAAAEWSLCHSGDADTLELLGLSGLDVCEEVDLGVCEEEGLGVCEGGQ